VNKQLYPPKHRTESGVGRFLLVGLIISFATCVFFAWMARPAGAQVAIDATGTGDSGNAGILGPAIIVVLATAFVKKVVDFPAYIKGKDYDSVVKTSLAWIAGIAVAFLLQATDFAKDFQLAGVVLADTNPATVIFFGLSIASAASVGTDFLASRDNTRTSATPSIVGPPAPAPPQG
jgi:hypothetical protein